MIEKSEARIMAGTNELRVCPASMALMLEEFLNTKVFSTLKVYVTRVYQATNHGDGKSNPFVIEMEPVPADAPKKEKSHG